ncbi:unnamed protein product [Diplocarpon coronariae]
MQYAHLRTAYYSNDIIDKVFLIYKEKFDRNLLDLPIIPLIIYTDLYSLYKCLIKLSTIKEKRLIINIIGLRQLYKRRELAKIR